MTRTESRIFIRLIHENSRFQQKSGIFFIFQDNTGFDGIITEHQIVHPVPPVLNFSVWYSIKRASWGGGIFGDAVVCSRALDDLILSAKLKFAYFFLIAAPTAMPIHAPKLKLILRIVRFPIATPISVPIDIPKHVPKTA